MEGVQNLAGKYFVKNKHTVASWKHKAPKDVAFLPPAFGIRC